MPSQQYSNLRQRHEELVRRFVDFTIPLNRDPTSHELDMIASFKLLMHSEIETFIEDRVTFAIAESVQKWNNQKLPTRCLFNLVVRWYPWFEKERNPFVSPQSVQQIEDLVSTCARKARDEISQNNGIKQAAFTRLAYSGGLLNDDLSGTLLASLESYGASRGDVAHKAVGRVSSLNDPRVEADDARQLVQLLEQFDEGISAIIEA
jgi:hypothetical protein